jgi:hypothetical protein
VSRVHQIEAGKAVRPVAEHAHAEALEALEGRTHVQDRLDARAHDDDPSSGQGVEVGRLVPALARTAMDPAQPARGEQPDAGAGGEVRGGRDGGGPVAASRCRRSEVAHAALDDVLAAGDHAQARLVEADARLARHERDGGRQRSALAHGGLHLTRDLQVLRPGEPVADQRALESNHWTPAGERFGDLGGDPHGPLSLRPHGREAGERVPQRARRPAREPVLA